MPDGAGASHSPWRQRNSTVARGCRAGRKPPQLHPLVKPADAQAAAAKPAAETVAVADAPKPADAQRDATPAQAKRRLPAANQDLRKCLDLESNAAIIKCAQP